ncbi:BatD family protein [Variovorax sp. Sphag1AA]|uniref:BatD family protein n=1 Tax=Variovorax sp. Sphag1AA TaxID=2587027 RepID=UPI001609AD00|nr:BatD family protein [Variovorax sp. Sphag1AA]MBB3179247.1 hypothetical protein [Variovorax sp. Sphag1AA]
MRARDWLRLGVASIVMCAAMVAHAAEPTARVHVEAKQPVLVGQQIRIQVEIVAPNFFTSPPPFPPMQIPGAIITMPDESGQNFVDVIDGQTFAGIRKTYIFAAQQAGDFVLPAVRSAFTYSGDDGKPRQGEVTMPQTRITAVLPAGAEQAQGQGAAAQQPVARITITQSFDRPVDGKSEHLRAGDALVRTLDTYAEMTQAMMIPPPRIEAPDGVRVFSADPKLSDVTKDREGFLGGRRIDQVTYVFEKSGTYKLPAIDIAWFDAGSGKSQKAEAPAVTITVDARPGSDAIAPEAAPVLGADEGGPPGFWQRVAWKRWLGGAVVVLLVTGLLLRWVARYWPGWKASRQERNARMSVSEPVLFEAVAQACRANDAAGTYTALLHWSRAHLGCTASAWSASLKDDELVRALSELETRLYGGNVPASPWNGSALLNALQRARSQWLAARALHPQAGRALRPLNPGEGSALT